MPPFHYTNYPEWGSAKLHNSNWDLFRRAFLILFLFLSIAGFAQSIPAEYFSGLKWRLIGPFRGGRAVAVAGVSGDPTTFYFGSVNGGVWKTTDAGVVWTPIFDGQSVGSIGAIAVAPSDPNTIYVGTGESDIRSSLSSGNGVYKSTDGGKTWIHLGLDDTRQISRIVVDPRDASVVYVGALGYAYGPNDQRGVFKSSDGGKTWAKVLDQGSEIGVADLAISLQNPDLLFAATWHTRRPPWSTYATIDGPGAAILRSRDAGKTWTKLQGSGLPEGDWGRTGVAVSSDGQRVYGLISAKAGGLYRSDDAGDHWTLANSDSRITSRAWYFGGITVDPQNRDVIYIPNVALYRSEDGGKTISVLRGAPGGDDYHQIWVDAKNSSSMVLGTDQGTTISLNRGQTWSSWYNQPTAQFYHVVTDNQFPYVVYGTQQDSGSAAVPSRTDHSQITPRDWFPSGGSESGYMVPDPVDPNIVYLTSSYGGVTRFNRRTGFSQDVSPWPVVTFLTEINERKYRAPWAPVLVLSPSDSKTLYLGTQYVMKTEDGGLHWQTISPDLTGAVPHTSDKSAQGPPSLEDAEKQGYGVLLTLAPSPRNRDVIWAGSDTGMIHVTRDAGKNWKDVTPPGLSDWTRISLIEASHFDPAVAYAAVERARLNDQKPYLYRTRDYGATWQLITDGIAPSAFLRAVREDPQTKVLLFAETELGIYVSFDDGDHWRSLQSNLPVTSIRDLMIHGEDLVVATFGRSFWILDNITPLRQANDARKADPAWLYRPATAVRVDNDLFTGTPLPPEEPTATNPPDGAVIDYFLKSPAKSITLEFLDGDRLIRRFTSEKKGEAKRAPLPVADRWFPKPEGLDTTPGLHRFVWNMKWASSGGPSADEDADFRNPSGPKVIPGTYQVRLTVDGKVQNQPLRVIMDPRSPATPPILKQQLQTCQKIFAESAQARRALVEMTSLQKKLADAEDKAGQNTSLKDALTAAQDEIGKMLTNKGETPGLQEASSDLASALRVAESGDRATPSQAMALYQEASGHAKTRLEEWSAFKQNTLPRLNDQLKQANLEPVAVAEIEREAEEALSQ